MSTILPPFPRLVFTVLEPLSLIAGWLAPFFDPHAFVSDQVLHSLPQGLTLGAHVVALQLGNVYLLLALLGIAVLYTTSEPKVVRNYIIALWIADIGHLAATYYVVGYKHFIDVGHWNSMAWGNIGATAFLFVTRSAYLIGLFGNDRGDEKRRV
ncbi:MAG: hypothetical protein M1830_007723 [Pleopsidium flavum]|nr:MAG: hypothetical protein M1830_007723 [Pleopsidium flavum]